MGLFFTYIFVLGACAGLMFVFVRTQLGDHGGPDLSDKPMAQLGMGIAFVLLIAIVEIVNALLSLFGIKDDWVQEILDKK